jgi:hypothetical protein
MEIHSPSRLPSNRQASTNSMRPYKGYSAILMRFSDSTSNYNALQLYAAKRKGDLAMTVSYTWSKSLSDSSADAENLEDPFNRRFNYGPTTFDRRHIFVTTYTYRLPFFRKFKGLIGEALSGWELSGITRWQTGPHLTPTGATSIGNRRADSTDVDIDGPRTVDEWFNKSAFTQAPNERRGTSGVGVIEGPGRKLWDLSLRKKFALTEKSGYNSRPIFLTPGIKSISTLRASILPTAPMAQSAPQRPAGICSLAFA